MTIGTYLGDLGGTEDKGTPELIQIPVLESVLLLQFEEKLMKAPKEGLGSF